MQINTNPGQSQQGGQRQRRTFIDPNPKKEKEMLDRDGNVIDPRTKQILKYAEQNK